MAGGCVGVAENENDIFIHCMALMRFSTTIFFSSLIAYVLSEIERKKKQQPSR